MVTNDDRADRLWAVLILMYMKGPTEARAVVPSMFDFASRLLRDSLASTLEEDAVAEMLQDLIHFCSQEDLDFGSAVQKARLAVEKDLTRQV